ncbi:GNAT family N-acetyltransferase [Actinoplanes hulinensis]|uniref:GNAT family N-acetyltransferase n=1 Tax=Actinoplanes hulinensis TaxID=1144547 RepID=A0ABS7BFA8_9ACTN|nr:GNAT family N-acetyltransferase [Actinoplanes hulinensis]MBW6439568.1 GNAT family N-acetyltransferase [Actinoplanes hulinensis]
MSISVRPFTRGDREQVTGLVNAHIAAVVPGVSVSVQVLLSQLEREPGEFIVDRWARERITLVAEQRGRVVAAAHLIRYGEGPETGEMYRNAGEIRWLVCWPDAPYWPDSLAAGDALAVACHAQLRRWGVARSFAEGALPAPGVYGVPEQWPHIRAIYERIGFRDDGRVEAVLLAPVDRLARPAGPVDGLTTSRTVGINGTRITALLDGAEVGHIEVDTNLDAGPRVSRVGAWAEVGNLWVEPDHRRQRIGTWLLGQAAAWLELGGATRLLDYADVTEEDYTEFLVAAGFTVLTRTTREFTADGV